MERDMSYPYSPDILERESSDNGFSMGWGMHFPAAEKCWTDFHAHMDCTPEHLGHRIKDYIELAEDHNINHTVIILPMLNKDEGSNQLSMKNPFKDSSEVKQYISMFNGDPRFKFFLYLDYGKPDAGLIKSVVKEGISGIKLHNAPVITDGFDHEVWLSDEWREVFREIEKSGLPVLWHVTQRLTDSPYTDGGRNSYWKDGWKKGVTYTNEDLLQVFLKVVGANPGINFVVAHQLHMGWERLTGLFDRYENLFSDTSVGCLLRKYDELNSRDRDFLRNIFTNYSKRLLFGTDIMINNDNSFKKISNTCEEHIRFIKQLRLPYDALQDISYLNAGKLLP